MPNLCRSWRLLLWLVGLILLVARAPEPVCAIQPRVVALVPAHGDLGVDPALTELRVEFDQDMDTRGYSIMGGGESFPQVTAQPQWIDRRTCVLEVSLEPGCDYRLGINGPRNQGFLSMRGEPARAAAWWFRTAGRDDTGHDPRLNESSYGQLTEAIENRYSYADLRDVEWESLFEEWRPDLLEAPDAYAFALRTGQMLSVVEDPHISVYFEELRFPTYIPTFTPNMIVPRVTEQLNGVQQRSSYCFSGHLAGKVGYVFIGTWNEEDALAAVAAIDEMRAMPQLVVDVRLNNGGNEDAAKLVAARFIDEPVVYAQHVLWNEDGNGGSGGLYERILEPAPEGDRYPGPVAVLQGPMCMSSNEAFLLMMAQAPRAVRVGMTSYGSSGNPAPLELANGVVVHLPRWRAMDADGVVFEGVGITPDVELTTTLLDFRTKDPVLERALEQLR